MHNSDIILNIQKLDKGYGVPGTATHRPVLSNLSFQVNRGESIAITGPSGSGKTTLLNLIAGLDRPDAGNVNFLGRNLANFSDHELDTYRNRSIGMVFQLHHLLPQCTLIENVLLPTLARTKKAKRRFYKERAEELVKRMGLWEMRFQYPGELSGGECQRTAVARALINDPELILADEPTGALDETNALNLIELLIEINQNDGKTIMMVTHSPELSAKMARIINLRHPHSKPHINHQLTPQPNELTP
jgi:ABC-type lipoprotein export system ATPase subunit